MTIHQILQERLLKDMLAVEATGAQGLKWKVLILDPSTTKIISSVCKMSDLLDQNISVVEDLNKKREPQPLPGVYFISPKAENMQLVIDDFTGKKPKYMEAHIFCSGKVSTTVLNQIKSAPQQFLNRLKTVKEVYFDCLLVDSRTFITDQPDAFQVLYNEKVDQNKLSEVELTVTLDKLCSVLLGLKEFPSIRYKSSKHPDQVPGSKTRSLMTQSFANYLNDRLVGYQSKGLLPEKETCDLLIMDRCFDQVVPYIHDWSYEGLLYDQIKLQSNKYFQYEYQTADGQTRQKEVCLDEDDNDWSNLRHKHFVEAIKAAKKLFDERRKVMEISSNQDPAVRSKVKNLAKNLQNQLDKSSQINTHMNILAQINQNISKKRLKELGELEEKVVFGEVNNSRDLLNFVQQNMENLTTEDKVRLFACFIATHPEKLDADKRQNWMRVAKLSDKDMQTIINLQFLGVQVSKAAGGGKGLLSFGLNSNSGHNVRRNRKDDDEDQYILSRFSPLLQETIEQYSQNTLSSTDFPFVVGSGMNSQRITRVNIEQQRLNVSHESVVQVQSGDSRQGRASGWKSGRAQEHKQQRRLIIFMIGGLSRNEIVVVHRLAKSLNKDIIIGSNYVYTPQEFLQQTLALSAKPETL